MRSRGFTAIELLVVIAIAAILVALALPSFRDVIARYRVQRASEDLVATLYFARSEAMRRGGQVTLRKSPTATGCNAPTNQDWSCGWLVFFDQNENGIFDAITDAVLRTTGIPAGVDVMTTKGSGPAAMTFDRWGHSSAVAVGFGFHFQPASGTNGISGSEKIVCVSIAGRIRTLTDLPACP